MVLPRALVVGSSLLALALSADPAARARPAQDKLEARLRRVLEQARVGDAAAREAARAELRELRERSWGDCFKVYRRTEDERLASALRHELGIAGAAEADVVVRGEITRIEHAQGGVVDHHDLIVHFARPFEVWKGKELAAKHRFSPTMLMLARGTHRDTWLCELMKRELERGPADVVLALTSRSLRYGAADGGPGTAFVFFEFEALPAEADAARAEIVGGRGRSPR